MGTSQHRGRFAPSPTGELHLGNAWAALLGWLWARSEGGAFLLRIEDLDRARLRPGAVETLLADMEWLGLDFDEEPVVQSERAAFHDRALESLRVQERVYPCFCSRSEIARAVNAPHGPGDDGPVYPGTCAGLSPDRAALRGSAGVPLGSSGGLDGPTRDARAAIRPPAWRFRPTPGQTRVEDLLHGPFLQDVAAEVGDFVVRRNDGVASYQLAVVVDDAASGITHVLRGEDLLSSTPRQLQVARALGLPVPAYAHVPLLLGPDGKRLAKREGPPSLAELRRAGVPGARLVGLLARWARLGDGTPVAPAALVPEFSLERVPREAVTVDPEQVRQTLLG